MAFQNKPGQFALFKNDKQGNPNRPDYTGNGLDLDGKPIRVGAWLKDGKNGKFMSCLIEPDKTKVRTADVLPPPAEELDDSIPF